MSYNGRYATSDDHSLCIASESTYGAEDTSIASGDSVRIQGGFSSDYNRETRDDNVVSVNRSRQNTRDGKEGGNVNFTTPIYMPGGTNTLETSLLLRSLGLSETVGGSDVTYAPATRATTLPSMCLLHHYPEYRGDKYTGGAASQLTIEMPESEDPTFQWQVGVKKWITAPTSAHNGAMDGTGTPVGNFTPSTLRDARGFLVGGLITVGTQTARRVTAINRSSGTVSFTPNVTTDEGTDPVINPYTPYSAPTAGTQASVTEGGFTLDGTSLCFKSGQIVLTNPLQPRPCWGSATVNGFAAGRMQCSGSIVVVATAAEQRMLLLGMEANPDNREYSLVWTFGDSSTSGAFYITVTVNAVLKMVQDSLADENGALEATLEFEGQDTGTANTMFQMVSQTA